MTTNKILLKSQESTKNSYQKTNDKLGKIFLGCAWHGLMFTDQASVTDMLPTLVLESGRDLMYRYRCLLNCWKGQEESFQR